MPEVRWTDILMKLGDKALADSKYYSMRREPDSPMDKIQGVLVAIRISTMHNKLHNISIRMHDGKVFIERPDLPGFLTADPAHPDFPDIFKDAVREAVDTTIKESNRFLRSPRSGAPGG